MLLELTEQERQTLIHALKLYEFETHELSTACVSSYLKTGFRNDSASAYNLRLLVERLSEKSPKQVQDQRIRELLAKNQIINAIKYYREQTGLGLKESKDYVDSLRGTVSNYED